MSRIKLLHKKTGSLAERSIMATPGTPLYKKQQLNGELSVIKDLKIKGEVI